MKSEDAIRIVREAAEYGWNPQCLTCEIRHEDRPNQAEAVAQLEADARALADVRTLDEWLSKHPERNVELYQHDEGQTLTMRDEEEDRFDFFGATPDAARHAAAEWVRGQSK